MILAAMVLVLLIAVSCAGPNSNSSGRGWESFPPRSPSGHICTDAQYCL